MHKYLDTGGVMLFEGVVDCKGSELQVGGKEHSNIVEFVTIEYSVTAVEVTEVNGHLQVNEEILPGACTLACGGCELEEEAGSLQLLEPLADLSASSLCAALAPLKASLSALLSRTSGRPEKKSSCHLFVNSQALI